MLYFHSWSGGKDSTASVILDHLHGLPHSKIIFSEVMFDKKRGISGEMPEHIEWVKEKAIPLFQEWGYEVEILHSEYDYVTLFNRTIEKSKTPERNGKIRAFPLGGMCYANRDMKSKALNKFFSKHRGQDYIQYVGIAIDEPRRLESLHKRKGQVSLLEQFGYTEEMAYQLCKKYDLLSPIYKNSKRGGCWFCPNASIKEMAYTKAHYPEMWEELARLSRTPNMVSQGFVYGRTFAEIDQEIDKYLEQEYWKAAQMTVFDFMEEEGQ